MRWASPLLLLLACPAPPEADPPAHTDADTVLPETDSDSGEDTEMVDTVPPDPPAPSSVELLIGDPVVCADPSLRDTEPLSAPVDGGPDWQAQPFDPAEETLFTGGGITTVDVDGNGLLDLWLTGVDGTRLYLQHTPWQFTDSTATLPDVADRSVAAVPVDIDDDGDLDLFIARYRRADQLWRNDGHGVFSLHPAALEVAGPTTDKSVNAAFGDVDRDGDLDLIVSTYGASYQPPLQGEPSRLYEYQDGHFTDRSDALPESVQLGYSFNMAWQDLNGDQLPELYVVNDHGERQRNTLIWNRGDFVFEPDDGNVGLDVRLQGMGLAIEDFNGDEVMDFAVAGWANNRLMVSQGPIWADEHRVRAFDGQTANNQSIGWGPHAGDLNNDGRLDLALGFGMVFNQTTPRLQPDEVFIANELGTYDAVGRALGADNPGQTRGILLVDLDRDGWLDLVRKDLIGPATLQRTACGEEAWLEVDLEQLGVNRDAIGADVRVRHGDKVWRTTIRAGGTSIFSAGPPTAHFGLADAAMVQLDVFWPDGRVDSFEDVPTRRGVHIRRTLDLP